MVVSKMPSKQVITFSVDLFWLFTKLLFDTVISSDSSTTINPKTWNPMQLLGGNTLVHNYHEDSHKTCSYLMQI